MIEKLARKTGDARSILGVKSNELEDISGWDWSRRLEVLGGLHFDRFLISDTTVRPNFVECTFSLCRFSGVRSQAHFWGASNLWSDCQFENMKLTDVISPQNRFVNCTFRDVQLSGYQPSETAFVNCHFHDLVLTGMKVQPNLRNSAVRAKVAKLWPFPELAELDAARLSLLFRKCRFERVLFKNCHVGHTAFEGSTFTNPRNDGSSFEGVTGENDWWSGQTTDVNSAYLDAVGRALHDRLGETSWSATQFEIWRGAYSGKHPRSAWFEHLVENGIPDRDYEVVEEVIDALDKQFPK